MRDLFWTEDKIVKAQKLWQEGFSAREIAELFGSKKNTVINMAHRNRDRFPSRQGCAQGAGGGRRGAGAGPPSGPGEAGDALGRRGDDAARADDRRAGAMRAVTPREREIIGWMAQGKTAAEIGTILGISPITVNTHIANAKAKLGVFKETALVAAALRNGIIR